jgi:hypothetical protein
MPDITIAEEPKVYTVQARARGAWIAAKGTDAKNSYHVVAKVRNWTVACLMRDLRCTDVNALRQILQQAAVVVNPTDVVDLTVDPATERGLVSLL